MSDVRIISASYPIYDPYTKTPEELIKDRFYTDLSMVYASVEVRTNYAVATEMYKSSNDLNFHIVPSKQKHLEYYYHEIESDDITKQEDYFMLQMDLWDYALKAYEKALEIGVNPEFAKYMLPSTMSGVIVDVNGNIPQWLSWIEKNRNHAELGFIVSMINKALNKYFPNTVEDKE